MEKTFNAAEAEARIYAEWEASGAFKAGANASRDETFCIMIPPPNVTGSLHVGHAFNNTLQDILTRWHRMRGFDTLWQPGQDHAGIATQMVVERKLAAEGNATRRDLGREDFLKKVWEWKTESGDTIINQLKRLGASCDWSRNAFTMSGAPNSPEGEEGNFHDAVIKVFVEMYNRGYIYRGKRLVNWDPHFETAISDLEVEQIEKDGYMWRLRYPLEDGESYEHPVEFDADGNVTDTETRDYLTVATTRPETMLGDTGVAVHPDDRRYAHLIGKHVILPITGRRVPIVADSYADPEKGTGAVKITPAHDFNDWDVGQRTGLRVINVMDTKAAMALRGNTEFAEGCPDDLIAAAIERLDGADRYEARDAIVTWAEEYGWLDGIDADRHMVPHGDRSKVSVEPFLTDQWFVDTAKIVEPALEAVRDGRTNIMPEQHRKVYFNWLENIQPWTISRQLWWGHQIPVWYGPKKTDDGGIAWVPTNKGKRDRGTHLQPFCAPDEASAIALAKAYYGDDFGCEFKVYTDERAATFDRSEDDMYEGYIPLYRDPDVLDTWFSSGLWPIGTLGWPEQTPELERYFPTSVLISGFDIIFFWVARMMMMQLAVVDEVPFKDVYVHALVRDEKGRKMSKSIGNVLDPLELIDTYGADALRFTMASMAAMGRDVKLSDDRVAGYRNFGTKLWNAARFAEMNDCKPLDGFDPASVTQTVNKWIVGEIARARVAHDEALTAYRFNDAANGLYAITWGRVCDWYLEFAKPLFASGDEAVISETRATMAWVIDQCLILLHPVMPFVTEELWGQIAERPKMLIHADWPSYGAELIDEEADREISWVIAMIDEIRSVRMQMHVPAGLKVPLLQAELDARGQAAWDRNAAIIQRIARVDSLTVVDDLPKGAVTVAVEGGVFGLPIADIIDVDEEKARLEKVLGKLAKELGGLRGRLNNPKFAESAPAAVVEETRNNLAAREEEEGKIRDALARLEEIG
ncbi:valine--tRNA ligase [Roseobacter sp. HKCCD9010]|uniref:valine--tRNA ligase n=1 Tax=unclassified Roseobacter TaxID=196798 RepID=UPI001492FFE6|nr:MULTISPECIES: valine--tRNA ligase [unclassified Roseobacter]MBF9051475.1 valine--tRNA ligase [Rhodobacterales bacterium HKCCD4356]NNV12999.1 valine--tRNA ligase [Roseobacter sp. HKCCD7357]NNV17250.1 valine--tRNA ligase [Roseobacter sp. HKCCD8768]NNV26856.1 valine--tRNA ligase [Roseobacter sp. HKCCD8192]NNV30976.1 valine--tRNA ligase [Roseobacter sp. HKCCD9061]